MRYEMRENSQGWDMFDCKTGEYLNTDECVDRLNEQEAEVEQKAKEHRNLVEAHTDLVEMMEDVDFDEVERLEAENKELEANVERLKGLVKATEAELFTKKEDCNKLRRELEAVKKITRDKYRNANEVLGLDLGKEVER